MEASHKQDQQDAESASLIAFNMDIKFPMKENKF